MICHLVIIYRNLSEAVHSLVILAIVQVSAYKCQVGSGCDFKVCNRIALVFIDTTGASTFVRGMNQPRPLTLIKIPCSLWYSNIHLWRTLFAVYGSPYALPVIGRLMTLTQLCRFILGQLAGRIILQTLVFKDEGSDPDGVCGQSLSGFLSHL